MASVLDFGYDRVEKKSDKTRCARCKFCNTVITDGIQTTSNFLGHLKTRHKPKFEDFKKAKAEAPKGNQLSLSDFSFGETISHYPRGRPKQVRFERSVLTNLIVGCSLPISVVENNHFRKFVDVMDAKITPLNSKGVKRGIDSLYQETKQDLYNELEKAECVSVTIDIWSDRKMRGFIGITVHFISQDLKLQSKLLACERFKGSHTGTKIAETVASICTSFKLNKKLHYIITDNASNMKKAFTVFMLEEEDQDVRNSNDVEMAEMELENNDMWEDVDSEVIDTVLHEVSANNGGKGGNYPSFMLCPYITISSK
jgi:hypothetical protein